MSIGDPGTGQPLIWLILQLFSVPCFSFP